MPLVGGTDSPAVGRGIHTNSHTDLWLCITTVNGDTVQASTHLSLSGGTTHVCLPALTRQREVQCVQKLAGGGCTVTDSMVVLGSMTNPCAEAVAAGGDDGLHHAASRMSSRWWH